MDFWEFDIHNVQNHPDFPQQCGGVWGRKEERGKHTRRQAPAAAVLSPAGWSPRWGSGPSSEAVSPSFSAFQTLNQEEGWPVPSLSC